MTRIATERTSPESLAVSEFEKLAARYDNVLMDRQRSEEVLQVLRTLAPLGSYIGPRGPVQLTDITFAPDQEGIGSFQVELEGGKRKDEKFQERFLTFLELYRRFEPHLL